MVSHSHEESVHTRRNLPLETSRPKRIDFGVVVVSSFAQCDVARGESQLLSQFRQAKEHIELNECNGVGD